jgi:diguanylate cyclase (GGDEF)-like protein
MNPATALKALDVLPRIINTLKTTQEYERVFHLLVDRLVRVYGAQVCAIVLIDPSSEYLNVENSHGLSWTFCKEFRRRLATGTIGHLLWTGAPCIIANSADQPREAEEIQLEHPFGSAAAVQISANHRTLGYLYLACSEAGRVNTGDLPLLQLCADLAGIAVYKSRLAEENLRLDRVDQETGLEKYVPFLDRLHAARERAFDFNEDFAVLVLDVDNFKSIVNTFGYEASRTFLHELGDIVRGRLRAIDAAARFGPDEIILLLATTGLEDAVDHARALRETVERHRFTPQGIASTISIGIGAFPNNGRTEADLIQSAKSACFEAQRLGRNSVFHYEGEWFAPDAVLHQD